MDAVHDNVAPRIALAKVTFGKVALAVLDNKAFLIIGTDIGLTNNGACLEGARVGVAGNFKVYGAINDIGLDFHGAFHDIIRADGNVDLAVHSRKLDLLKYVDRSLDVPVGDSESCLTYRDIIQTDGPVRGMQPKLTEGNLGQRLGHNVKVGDPDESLEGRVRGVLDLDVKLDTVFTDRALGGFDADEEETFFGVRAGDDVDLLGEIIVRNEDVDKDPDFIDVFRLIKGEFAMIGRAYLFDDKDVIVIR